MKKDPKLLIISYVFPPAGGITVQRALSLAKYLPRCGFEVHVLTAGNAATPVVDPGLLKHVPPEVTVHRSFTPELPFYFRKKLWNLFSGAGGESKPAAGEDAAKKAPAPPGMTARAAASIRKLFSPDPQVVWVPFAIRRGAQIIRKHKIDFVLVTAPPFSVFLTGNALKRKFPHIRLISDFRDEWIRFYIAEFEFLRDDYMRRRAETIERATIENSDLVVAVTRSSLDEIAGRYPAQPAGKFALIANGYDPESFAAFTPRPHEGRQMVVTHAGTVYKSSSPHFFLSALDGLPDEIRRGVETRFLGRIAETEQALMKTYRNEVKILGFVPQKEALRYMEETDFLLLTMTNDYSLPGKLFEYMATGKPILAISPPHGEVARILRETGAGWCADPEKPDEIKAMLRKAWEHMQSGGGGLTSANRDAIRRYERPRLAEELAGVLRARF